MFIEKLVGKNLSISSKNLGFRMIFKLVTESIFEQTYTFCVSIWVFFARYDQSLRQESNFFFFNFQLLHL